MYTWRLYIDESGDHTYKKLDDLNSRYLGITGVLIKKKRYDEKIQPDLEQLKRSIFRYDPDNPPILVRSLIRGRKQWFYLLQDQSLNSKWETGLLAYLHNMVGYAQVFTVVMDKKQHLQQYPLQTFDPYTYSLVVLLNRVRGFLQLKREQADVLAESRGHVEDKQIQLAYELLLKRGPNKPQFGKSADYQSVFPHAELLIRKKYQNIAGLQIADVLAHDQKLLTITEAKKPLSQKLGAFGQQINNAAGKMVNSYGRYMLE